LIGEAGWMQLQEGMYLMDFRGEFDKMKKIIGVAKICISFFLLCSALTFGFPIRSGHCEEPKANTALDEKVKILLENVLRSAIVYSPYDTHILAEF
jgi:hypothetical protein